MKKIFPFLLVAALTACGQSETPQKHTDSAANIAVAHGSIPYLDTVCLILFGGVFVWAGAEHFLDFEALPSQLRFPFPRFVPATTEKALKPYARLPGVATIASMTRRTTGRTIRSDG